MYKNNYLWCMELKLSLKDKMGILFSILIDKFGYSSIWISVVFILPIFYFTMVKNEEKIITHYTVISSHYDYNSDGEKEYHYNVVDESGSNLTTDVKEENVQPSGYEYDAESNGTYLNIFVISNVISFFILLILEVNITTDGF